MAKQAKPGDSQLYALGKLAEAVRELVTGAGHLQERLAEAALCLVMVRPDEIPDKELRRIFEGVKADLAFQPAQGSEGRIAATLRSDERFTSGSTGC